MMNILKTGSIDSNLCYKIPIYQGCTIYYDIFYSWDRKEILKNMSKSTEDKRIEGYEELLYCFPTLFFEEAQSMIDQGHQSEFCHASTVWC